MKLECTTEELYEINDALMEVIDRMLHEGQTQQEIDYGSLRVMWGVRQRARQAVLGDFPKSKEGLELEEQVKNAIQHPKLLDREHAYS